MKKLRKIVAMALALSMLMSLMSVQVLAADREKGTAEVESKPGGGKEVVDVLITINGNNVHKETAEGGAKTESGANVQYESTETRDADGNVISGKTSYEVENGTYSAQGGSEITTGKGGVSDPNGIKVNVSLTEGGQNTATGNAKPNVTGDTKDSEEEGDYNYTSTTVKEQASVTVTTNKVTVEDIFNVNDDKNASDLTHVNAATDPSATNDLYKEEESAAPAEGDGYQFVSGSDYQFEYKGSGNTSQFRPAVVFTEPLSDKQKVEQYGDDPRNGAYIFYGENGKDENGTTYNTSTFVSWLDDEYEKTVAKDENGNWVTDEAGYILDIYGNRVLKDEKTMVGPDGKTYYLHRFDNNGVNNYVEGWYIDGKWVEELNGSAVINESGNPIAKNELTISPIKVQKVDENGNPVFNSEGNPVYVTVTTGYKTYKGEDGKTDYYVLDEDGNILVSYGAVWAGAQQFVLVDKETGEVVTTYCADIATKTQDNFGYNIVNLEDSTYYDEAQAKQIRTIATNGYWGTTGTETDEEGNTVPKAGSLEAMKQMLLASGQFTADELASLNDGVALSATQMAIWSCSNHMAGAEFVNTNYVETQYTTGYVPQDKEDETKLMFKIYEYLTHLTPTEIEKPTTADTIINADNFLKDMSVTVIEKAEDHENNKNESDKDDAYVTNLSFALVVTPSTENGDNLVVKVLDPLGNVLACGRVAGENKDGESYDMLTADENGNYTLSGITLVEGSTNFNLTLEGVQNLKEGVYLYTSEIDTAEDENPDNDRSSQTMVGMAGGKREVGVSMKLEFELSVEDAVVVTERVWRSDYDNYNPPGGNTPPSGGETPPSGEVNPPEDIIEIPDEDTPLVDIPEDDIPLADVPKTGDASALWMALSALSAAGLFLIRKKSEDEE